MGRPREFEDVKNKNRPRKKPSYPIRVTLAMQTSLPTKPEPKTKET